MCSYKSHACMRIGRISWTKWTPVNEQNKVAKQRKHVSAVFWMGVPWTFLGLSFRLFNTFSILFYKLSRHHDLVIAATAADTKVYSNAQNFPFPASAWVRFFHDNSISNLKIHFHTPKTGFAKAYSTASESASPIFLFMIKSAMPSFTVAAILIKTSLFPR